MPVSPRAEKRTDSVASTSSASTSSSSPRVSPPYPTTRPVRGGGSGSGRTTRQQFSACGACRMRRVRCDLKDLPLPPNGLRPACSNCSERGLKCVDEFAEVKAVKLLRRGRRLQQVEAVYGKVSDEEDVYAPPPNIIPKLQPSFLNSPFFRRLHIQRPIIDATEFTARYLAYWEGNASALGPAGQLIANILVVWGASFGVNEFGLEAEPPEDPAVAPALGEPPPAHKRRVRKALTNSMLQQVLRMIDIFGILRKPSWDGVRVLLMTLPLTAEVQPPMERLSMYDSTLAQIYTLCSLAPPSSVASGQGDQVDALVRARIFWYAHIHEGVTIGLRGGRITLTDDDLASFQHTLPDLHSAPLFPEAFGTTSGGSGTTLSYSLAARYASLPLRIASACRQVHDVLTGPKARTRNALIDEMAMRNAWDALEECFRGLEALKECGTTGVLQDEDVERFIDSWQIFVFECHNIIREGLKQRLFALEQEPPGSPSQVYYMPDDEDQKPASLSQLRRDQALRLHAISSAKCHHVVKRVVGIICKHFANYPDEDPPFFAYDASMIRDGCFFAAFLLASDDSGVYMGTEDELSDDIEVCLRALRAMKWRFSISEEREHTVRMVWETARRKRLDRAAAIVHNQSGRLFMGNYPTDPAAHQRGQRPHLAPLSMQLGPQGLHHRPSMASTDDSGGPWSAAPPPTSTPVSPARTPDDPRRLSPTPSAPPSFVPPGTMHVPSYSSVNGGSSPGSVHGPPFLGPAFDGHISSMTPQTPFYYPAQPLGYSAGPDMLLSAPPQVIQPPRQIQLEPAPSPNELSPGSASALYPTWPSHMTVEGPYYQPQLTEDYEEHLLLPLKF